MPSPTATMRPTSAETRLASKSFKRSLMTSEISRVLMLTSSLLRGRQPAAQLVQSSGDARVDDPVAVLQFHPAEDARINDDAQPYVLVETFRQLADFDQAARPLVDLAVLLCQLEDRAGVTLSRGRRHSPPPGSHARSAFGAWARRGSRRSPSPWPRRRARRPGRAPPAGRARAR